MRRTEDETSVHYEYSIVRVDDRSSFRRDDRYPRLILLATVLRWAVKGNYTEDELEAFEQTVKKIPPPELLDELQRFNDEQRLMHSTFSPEMLDEIEKRSYPTYYKFARIRCNNNSAMSSVGSLLADGIESEDIAVFNVHSLMSIGRTEKELLVSRLRTMDEKSNLDSLIDLDACDKYLDGKQLFQFVMDNIAPVDGEFQGGRLWFSLLWEAADEWRTLLKQTETEASAPEENADSAVAKVEAPAPRAPENGGQAPTEIQAVIPNGNADSDDWKVKAIGIADKIALSRWENGLREITARNICDAVATELGKDITTHGNRGSRSAGSVRSVALKGWKFTPLVAQMAQVA